MGGSAWCAIALLVLASADAAGQTTLRQLTNVNDLGVNDVGIRYFGAAFGVSAADANFGPVATDGASLLLFDKLEYERRVRTLGLPTGIDLTFEPEFRLPFVGSGLDMIQLNNAAGESYEWEVVDSGSSDNFNVVASGTMSTFGPSIAAQTVNLVPQGTLSTDRMHILRVKAKDTDGLANTGKWRVILDAVGIYDDAPLTYDDDSNFSGNWTFSNPSLWALGFNDALAYEGTRSASSGPGESVSIDFTGTSIAVLGFSSNSGSDGGIYGTGNSLSGTYTWEIDGGTLGSGRVDQSIDSNFALRWPELLINNLPSGPHTLTITVDGLGTEGRFSPNGGFVQIDAIAVFDSGITNPENADFDGVNGIDGKDFLIWQQGLGIAAGATLGQGDANGDGRVDGADLGIWESQFGASASVSAVPEPSGVAAAFCALGAWCVRPRRKA